MFFNSTILRIQVTYKSGTVVYFSGDINGECSFSVNKKYAKKYKSVKSASKDFDMVRAKVKKMGATCILV